MREHDAVYRVEACCTHESAKALRILIAGKVAAWVPKSQIHPDSPVQSLGDEGELVCSLWIAQQKGWA